jgi:uncharacterized protein
MRKDFRSIASIARAAMWRRGSAAQAAFVLVAASTGAAFAQAPDACGELQRRFDASKQAATAIEISNFLFSAADKNCVELARELIDGGASAEARDRMGAKPLSHAARFGHEAMVDLLLDRGAPIDARNLQGATALYMALDNGHGVLARDLIARGADVTLPGHANVTPLMAAAFHADDATAEILLAKGADANARDDTGKSAIVYAAARASSPIVARLLDRGIDVNARYANDLTLLMWGAGYDDSAKAADAVDVVRLLLDRGARIEDRDNRGRTALMIAAETNHAEVVDLLLSRGADPQARDKAGKVAADIATQAALREKLSRR